MRILITGLGGFTGYYLKQELESQGHCVQGLKADLTNSEEVAKEIAELKPEAVAHLGGISYVDNRNVSAFYQVNLIGTQNLLVALYENASDVRSILLSSSAIVYGNQSKDLINEEITPIPTSDYAVSKLAMEQMASLWMERLPLFIVRPFNYTGIGQKKQFLIPKIVSHFLGKKTILELGYLDVWREFGDVRVVVEIYRKLLDLCPRGKTLNVCTGQKYSLKEVVLLCETITGHSIEVRENPEFVRSNEVLVLRGSNSLLNKVIGPWKPYQLEETLMWMLGEGDDS
ncbi:GDP-mannose 4,6-dehydratase [Nitrospinaceae bacterium]|nr:GDP-mannose 4,6-dehydratase [Nitrospinaceae bacterium]